MIFQRADRCDHHGTCRTQPRHSAFDIVKLFGAEICGESGLRHHIIAKFQGHSCRRDGIASVRDIGKRTAVHKCGCFFKRLHQIRLDGILQQRRHRSLRLQVMRGNRLPFIGVPDNDPCKPFLQILKIRRKAEHRHDFARHRDVKTVFAGNALRFSAQSIHDLAELAIIHVNGSFPGDLLRIDPERVSLLDMIVQHGGEKIVRRSDRVKISGKMKVDILHGHDLRVTASRCAALDSEYRPEGRLPERDDHFLPDLFQTVSKPDRRCRLSFPGGRRRDSGNKDQLPVRLSRIVL